MSIFCSGGTPPRGDPLNLSDREHTARSKVAGQVFESAFRCRANPAHELQSRPDYGIGFWIKPVQFGAESSLQTRAQIDGGDAAKSKVAGQVFESAATFIRTPDQDRLFLIDTD